MTMPNAPRALPFLTFCFAAACGGGSPPPAAAPASEASPTTTPASGSVDATPITDPVANVPPTCKNGTKPAATGLVDDLEDGDNKATAQGGRDGIWWVGKADHAKIDVPGSVVKPSDGAPFGSKRGMHFVGKTDNSDTWGAAVGVNFLAGGGFYDASKYAGISFKLKSAKPNLDVRLKINDVATHPDGGKCSKQCFNAFGREIILGTEVKEVTLMWSELTQQSDWGDVRPPMIDPTKVKDLEWQIWPGVEFDLWIDDVQLLECK
jgi:hypothetical protein